MLTHFMNGGIDVINFLVDNSVVNADLSDACMGLEPVIRILKNVIKVIQFGVPILLILFGMIDLGKAVMSSKEDEMKKAQGTLMKRFIYAVAVFLVVTLVTFVMGIVSGSNAKDMNDESWSTCWNSVS